MNRGRTRSRSRCGSADSPVPEPSGPPAKSRVNRLSRGLRGTQRAPPEAAAGRRSPESLTSGLRTPSRPRPSRAAASSTDESPLNDSDLQQDIVWDATSPSPLRAGKRGRKAVAMVDISEIVRRIAPKHGRPAAAEPRLQQWIGDSAAIPCTPDIPLPKTKKKSPRLNAVDDLLQLAKQFDFSMFRQDQDQSLDREQDQDQDQDQHQDQHQHQQSLELLSQDIFESQVPAAPPQTSTSHQLLDDDLDFLFDGPTQRLSGDLSQFPAKGTSGKPPACGEAEDDWENDDFLNDSQLIEMTQNPLAFALPKLCSTQKPSGGGLRPLQHGGGAYPGPSQSARPKVTQSFQQNSSGSITKPAQSHTNPAAGSQKNSGGGAGRGGACGGASQSARCKVTQSFQQNSSGSVGTQAQSHTNPAAGSQKNWGGGAGWGGACGGVSQSARCKVTQSFQQNSNDSLTLLVQSQANPAAGSQKIWGGGAYAGPGQSACPKATKRLQQNSNDSLTVPVQSHANLAAGSRTAPTWPPLAGGGTGGGPGQSARSKVAQQNSAHSTAAQIQSRTNLAPRIPTHRPAAPTWPPAGHLASNHGSHDASTNAHSLPSQSLAPHGFHDDDLDAFFSCEPAWDEPAWDEPADTTAARHASSTLQTAPHIGGSRAGHSQQPANQQAARSSAANQRTVLGRGAAAFGRGAAAVDRQAALGRAAVPASHQAALGRGAAPANQQTVLGRGGAPANQESALGRGGAPAAVTAARYSVKEAESGRTQPEAAPRQRATFTFKKPTHPVSMATSRAAPCSEAEIELKKQQAMERRRRRLQEIHNLPAPPGHAPYR